MNQTIVDKRFKIYIWGIIIIMTSLFGFSGLVPILGSLYKADMICILLIIVSLISLFHSLLINKKLILKSKFSLLLWLFFLLVLIEIIYSFFLYKGYGQTLLMTIKESIYYIAPIFVYFSFINLKRTGNELRYLKKIIIISSIVCSIIAIIQFLFFTYLNINLLNMNLSYENAFRNGRIRFTNGGIILTTSLFLSFNYFLKQQNMKINLICVLLGVFQIVYFGQGRGMMLAISAIFILMIILNKKTNLALRLSLISIILVGIVISFLQFNSIYDYLFDKINGEDGLRIRIEDIEYYMNQFYDRPILGFGFITSNQNIASHAILVGDGWNNREDVGIIGYINTFGVYGLICFILLYAKLIKTVKCTINNERMNLIIILIYITITMGTLFIMSMSVVYQIAFILIYFECAHNLKNGDEV